MLPPMPPHGGRGAAVVPNATFAASARSAGVHLEVNVVQRLHALAFTDADRGSSKAMRPLVPRALQNLVESGTDVLYTSDVSFS